MGFPSSAPFLYPPYTHPNTHERRGNAAFATPFMNERGSQRWDDTEWDTRVTTEWESQRLQGRQYLLKRRRAGWTRRYKAGDNAGSSGRTAGSLPLESQMAVMRRQHQSRGGGSGAAATSTPGSARGTSCQAGCSWP